MKFQLLLTCLLVSALTFAGDGLTKEEKKQLKKELKEMAKDLEGYKSKKEKTAQQIQEDEIKIKKLSDDLAASATTQAEMANKMASLETKLKECQNIPIPTCPDDISKTPNGTVFKVQMGLFKNIAIASLLEKAKAFTAEQVDGINRYVVGSFATEEEANKFVEDMRKLGIKGAFVSKYVDGQRVFEWEKNPKYKGKKAPESLQQHLGN